MELLIIYWTTEKKYHFCNEKSIHKINYFELIFKVARLITFTTLLITSIQQLNDIIKISFWKLLHFISFEKAERMYSRKQFSCATFKDHKSFSVQKNVFVWTNEWNIFVYHHFMVCVRALFLPSEPQKNQWKPKWLK